MSGHRKFDDLVSRRVRFRSKLIRLRWRLHKMLGRCKHDATWGPAGGDVGLCAICGAEVRWEDD